jgi:hemoglobin/transferrin/lactoferrin receptor protein
MPFWKVLSAVALFAVVVNPLLAQEAGETPEGEPVYEFESRLGGGAPPIPATPDISLESPGLPALRVGQPGPFSENTGVLRSAGSVFDTERAVGIVRREDIEENQAADMFEALQNEVGVLLQSTAAGQASPFVRGLTGQQVLLLVDGIRLNNSVYRFGPNQYFNTIDPGMVDHIEVLRGSASVLWGSDAIGGAINVVTRSPDVNRACECGDYVGSEFTQYYNTSNSAPYSRLNAEGWIGAAGYFAGGSFLNVRDLDTGWDFGRQPGTNYQQYAGDIKLNYLVTASQMLTLSLQHLEQEQLPRSDRFPGFPGDLNNSNTPDNARFFDPQQRDLAYLRYQALWPVPWIDALTFTASYHRQRDVQTRGMPTERFQETDVDSTGLNLVASRDYDHLGRVTAGADWYYDDVDSSFGGTASGPIIPDDASYSRAGVFLNWDVPLTCQLDATAGVRYEHIDLQATPVVEIGGVDTPVYIQPHYSDWVGHVGLVYKLNPCVHLVGSIGEGFRAPNLDELTANNPNVLQDGMDLPSLDLISERSINYEVGVKTDFDRLRTQTFVFWNDLQNNIVPISAGSNQFQRDNQDSFIQGVEFDGEYLLHHGWSVYGNFWYIYGKNLVTDAPLSRIPPTQGIVGLRWREPETRSHLALYTWLVARQDRLDPVRDVSDERIPADGTPGYGTLNLRAGRAFGRCNQHRLSVSLLNITDKNYLVHGSGVFGTGFTGRLGYQWVY